MKELSIEEKAKAYDRAVEQIRSLRDILLNNGMIQEDGFINSNFQRIFPELNESEDEVIRKSIITYFKRLLLESSKQAINAFLTKDFKEYINWLEKQGEQKPKFRVGDTIKCKYDDRQFTIKSVDLDKGTYTYTQEGCGNDIDYADAHFKLVEQKHADKVEPRFKVGDTIIAKPSTYMEHKPFHITKIEDDYYWDGDDTILIGNQNNFKLVEQKPAWSEEDDVMIDNILGTYKTLEDMLDLTTSQDRDILESMNFERAWIMSLKNKPQPKQEWSEKDEKFFNTAL